MSHRSIERDPVSARKSQYERLEISGVQQEAIMEAFATLREHGFELGDKMNNILEQRETIKRRNPK